MNKMAQLGPPRSGNSQPDVLFELKAFIAGTTQSTKCTNQLELTKSALRLLKTLPAAREAVLEYFCMVFRNAASNYITRIETEIATGQLPPASKDDEITVTEIHSVICCLVSSMPESWAPIISAWSLELLGELSTRYSGRAHVSSGVNETLQLWMNCRATRTLIDITTQCLASLIHSDTEACINALLDTSVKHSPNFDWVVAHVGSCFPTTVITRVLSCGLKDFCQNKSYEQGRNAPKLKSVVGILGHLAGSNNSSIHTALLDLFKWSLEPISHTDLDETKLQKKATVPFLLQLAYLSPTLLNAISQDIGKTLSLSVIVRLCNFVGDWCKYFGSAEALEDLLVSLILKCETGGVQIIKVLLDAIFIDDATCPNAGLRAVISEAADEILVWIIQEVDFLIRKNKHQNQNKINMLESFLLEASQLNDIIVSPDSIKSSTAAKIMCFIGHKNPTTLIESATFLFENAKTDQVLITLINILTNELIDKSLEPYAEKGGHFSFVLEQVLSKHLSGINKKSVDEDARLWKNLLTLLEWEKGDDFPLLGSKIISKAIYANMENLTSLFSDKKTHPSILHIIVELFQALDVPSSEGHLSYRLSLQTVMSFTRAVVNYIFVCCKESDTFVRLTGCKRACEMLTRLSLHLKAAKMLALRELLERSLFTNDRALFGAKLQRSYSGNPEPQLLDQNRKNNKTVSLTKYSSVLTNGNLKCCNGYKELDNDVAKDNIEFLLRAIKACCALPSQGEGKKAPEVSLESLTSVSLLLVQFVSPDVMYNGLPWPEEEFCKVTIERDFYIRRLFNTTPLLWNLLSFVAVNRPTLCYCSVLLRALTATVIQQWNSMGEQAKPDDSDEKYRTVIETTVKVIEVMALGQLLPPPLSGIRDVIPFLKPSEIVQILRDCVWCYMRDNVPSPALFTCDSNGMHWRDPTLCRPPDVYTNTLRVVIQRNIKTVGHLYSHMFINIPTAE